MKKSLASLIKYLPVPLCAAAAAFFTYFPITDTDIFWHLAAGREMAAHRHFLFSDPFSFTLASPQWVDLHWLFQLIVYGLYLAGGLAAIIAFKLAVVAFVCVIFCLIFRSAKYIWYCAFLAAYLFYQSRYLVCERPVLVTMACMAAYLFLFEKVRHGSSVHWLWLCVPVQIVWTNSQGLYPIGIFIIGAYWVESLFAAKSPGPSGLAPIPLPEKKGAAGSALVNGYLLLRKPWSNASVCSLVLFFCCLSCCATPYGLDGLMLPFKLFGRISPVAQNIYSLNISENVPLMSLTGFEAGYRTVVIVTAVAASMLFVLNRKRTRVAHILLFSGFLVLAFIAVRNVLLYFMVIVPVISYGIMNADVVLRLGSRSVATKLLVCVLSASAGIGCLWSPCVDHWSTVASYPPRRVLSPFRFPEKITEYLKANPVKGEMFNDIRYGGYLIWEFYPGKKVFIDGRLVIRSDLFFREYLAICEQPGLFPYIVKKFNITHAILPFAIFDRYHKLIKWLYDSSDWRLEYTDGASFLFVRNNAQSNAKNNTLIRPAVNLSDSATVRAIARGIRDEWRDAPEVRREALGYFSEALAYLRGTAVERGR